MDIDSQIHNMENSTGNDLLPQQISNKEKKREPTLLNPYSKTTDKKMCEGTFLVVQWLRIASNVEDGGSILGWRTNHICHMTWPNKKVIIYEIHVYNLMTLLKLLKLEHFTCASN